MEIDHAMTHAVGLVKPDAVFIVHADVPERVHGTGRVVRHRQPDALVHASLGQLRLEVGALQGIVEALLDAARILRLHVVGAVLRVHLGVPCGLCRLRSEDVYIILAVSHPDLMLQSAGPLAIQAPASTPFSWPLIRGKQPPRSTLRVLRGGQLLISGRTILYL
jgi:hypothetical protein